MLWLLGGEMRISVYMAVLLLGGCAQTSIQPLTQTSFKVATEAEDFCGAQGTREIAFKAAAIEVIKRGGDRFIVVGDQSGSRPSGGQYFGYGVYQSYNSNTQDMVIQIVAPSDPSYSNSLSARQTLGANWQTIVSEGIPQTCS
jgi:hypothetical protein